MTVWECLRVTESDGVVEITLDRPAERNAIDARMVAELHAVCEELERHPRPAIITGGADGVFAGGADIAELRERGRDDALAGINLRLFDRLRGLPMPTIAAVDGYALGGGAELAYACDLRIGTPRTAFGQPEPRLGIIAGAGATYRLVRLVGESVAKQVLLAGVQISSQRALELGLVLFGRRTGPAARRRPSTRCSDAEELRHRPANDQAGGRRRTRSAPPDRSGDSGHVVRRRRKVPPHEPIPHASPPRGRQPDDRYPAQLHLWALARPGGRREGPPRRGDRRADRADIQASRSTTRRSWTTPEPSAGRRCAT